MNNFRTYFEDLPGMPSAIGVSNSVQPNNNTNKTDNTLKNARINFTPTGMTVMGMNSTGKNVQTTTVKAAQKMQNNDYKISTPDNQYTATLQPDDANKLMDTLKKQVNTNPPNPNKDNVLANISNPQDATQIQQNVNNLYKSFQKVPDQRYTNQLKDFIKKLGMNVMNNPPSGLSSKPQQSTPEIAS